MGVGGCIGPVEFGKGPDVFGEGQPEGICRGCDGSSACLGIAFFNQSGTPNDLLIHHIAIPVIVRLMGLDAGDLRFLARP